MILRLVNFARNSQLNTYKSYVCPECKMSFKEDTQLYKHVEIMHKDEMPEGFTPKQYVFCKRKNKWENICRACKINKTAWNEKTGRFRPVCDDEMCKAEQRRKFMENYKKKHGKEYDLSDPEQQKKMMNNRGISGLYKFRDGREIHYVGNREKEFLEHVDLDLELSSEVLEECAIYFKYKYNHKIHTYIPDFYFNEYNLIAEIKASDNMHPKYLAVDRETEKLKDEAVINSKQFNYIKIVDSEFEDFDKLIELLRSKPINEKLSDSDLIISIPKYKNISENYHPEDLKFLDNEKEFYHEIMKYIWSKYYNNKISLNLAINKNFIDEDHIDDDTITEKFTILRTEEINGLEDKSKINQAFKQLKLYYTKAYEIYLAQNFLGIYMPKCEDIGCIELGLDYKKDIEKLNENLRLHKHLTTVTKEGYRVYFAIHKNLDKVLLRGTRARFSEDEYYPIPGTMEGGHRVKIDLMYTAWPIKEE